MDCDSPTCVWYILASATQHQHPLLKVMRSAAVTVKRGRQWEGGGGFSKLMLVQRSGRELDLGFLQRV